MLSVLKVEVKKQISSKQRQQETKFPIRNIYEEEIGILDI